MRIFTFCGSKVRVELLRLASLGCSARHVSGAIIMNNIFSTKNEYLRYTGPVNPFDSK